MDQPDLHHLRCVVTLGEELNFGRAAARLHMSQPPLSRLVTEVERLVGARLFERTTRRVTLTPVGEVFVAEARAVLARAELAMENVRAAERRQAGKLRIGYTWLAFNTVVPRAVMRLREHEHDVSVDLVEMSREEQRSALARGHLDVGFVDEQLELEGFECRRLLELTLNVMLHAGHPLAERDRLPFRALADETLILHAHHEYPGYQDKLLTACRAVGFSPKLQHREARQSCIALVASGQGVLLHPAGSYPQLPIGLRSLPLDDTPPQLLVGVWAVLPNPSDTADPVSGPGLTLRELLSIDGSLE